MGKMVDSLNEKGWIRGELIHEPTGARCALGHLGYALGLPDDDFNSWWSDPLFRQYIVALMKAGDLDMERPDEASDRIVNYNDCEIEDEAEAREWFKRADEIMDEYDAKNGTINPAGPFLQ